MCGRVIQSSGPLNFAIVDGMNVRDSRVHNYPPRLLRRAKTCWSSGAIIGPAKCHSTRCAGASFPIGAMTRKVGESRSTPNAKPYKRCRPSAMLTVLDACIIPVDGFFEWMAIKGQKAKQPYAIAMKDGRPFGLGGLWENWKDPIAGEWIRTFAIITTDANELVDNIHDRRPLILAPSDYGRWLSDDPDPRELMRPFPAGPMRMWPVSTRVNKPENDDPDIVEALELESAAP